MGGAAFGSLIDALARGGRYVTAGAIGGPLVELDLRTLYLKDLVLHGSTTYRNDTFATLLDVVNHYADCFAVQLSDTEKTDLVEYLKSLPQPE